MRFALAAALVLAPAAASAADTPVDLKAGHDYALVAMAAEGYDTAEVIAPGGATAARVAASSDVAGGDEFRARFDATYLVRTGSPDTSAVVVPDCRGDARTQCSTSINHTQRGQLSWPGDRDWKAIRMVHGHVYTIRVDAGSSACAAVVNAKGSPLSARACIGQPARYRASSTGTFWLELVDDDVSEAADYALTVTAR